MTNQLTLKIFLLLLTVILIYYLLHDLVKNDNTKKYFIKTFSGIKQTSVINYKITESKESSLSQKKDNELLDDKTDAQFPHPDMTYQVSEMLKSHWVVNMKRRLDEAKPSKQLTFVLVNSGYFSTLLNWMVHAKLHAVSLLNNLFVVCLDEKSHITLTKKGVLSVVVKSSDLLKDTSKLFPSTVVVRLAVVRLLIYWGFDVLQTDIDALPMNNIQPIFDHFSDIDIIASTVERSNCVPPIAYNAWKFCICVGVLLIRSNPNTGMLMICITMQLITCYLKVVCCHAHSFNMCIISIRTYVNVSVHMVVSDQEIIISC